MNNKEIIQQYMQQIWEDRDLSAIDRVFNEDAAINSPLNRTEGRVTMKEMVEKWLTAFPDLTITTLDYTAEDDIVIVRWHAIGTHMGSFFDTHPTHREVAFSGVTTYKLDASKVTEYSALVDMHAILRQLGEYESIHEVVE